MAEKIRRQPDLLKVPREKLRRWIAAEPVGTPSQARREWREILESKSVEEILGIMTEPGEEGHRRRQSSPFTGILSEQEARSILETLL